MWKLILIGRSYTLIWDLDFKSAQCDKEIQEEPTTEVYLYYYFFFMRDIFEGIQTLNVDEYEKVVFLQWFHFNWGRLGAPNTFYFSVTVLCFLSLGNHDIQDPWKIQKGNCVGICKKLFKATMPVRLQCNLNW